MRREGWVGQVKGVLDKEEVLLAKHQEYLRHVHVVVATPAALAELLAEPDARPVMSHVKAIAIDEVDACLKVSLRPHLRVSRDSLETSVSFPSRLPLSSFMPSSI